MDENSKDASEQEKQETIMSKDTDGAESKSPGEQLIPLLVIAMECCLIYALLLVSAGLFVAPPGPLLPFWVILLAFLLCHWLTSGLKRHLSSGYLPRILRKVLAGLIMLCAVLTEMAACAWLRFYAGTFLPTDPAWLRALANDPGQADRAFQLVLIGMLLSFLAWISYRTFEKQPQASLLLSRGGPVLAMLGGISLIEELFLNSADFWQPPMLLATFLWLGLLAQALQKAMAKRRLYRSELEGGFRGQERIIFQVMSSLGLLVVLSLLGTLFAHGNLRLDLQWNLPRPPAPTSATSGGNIQLDGPSGGVIAPTTSSFSLLGLIQVVIAVSSSIFLLSLLILLTRLLLKYGPMHRNRRGSRDERKSLWSWSLFFSQWKALLRPLLIWPGQLFRKMRRYDSIQELEGEPVTLAIRDVRAIYHLFLQKATRLGYPRHPDETPQEFQQRLYQQEPQLNPELNRLTSAYTLVRYGGIIPRVDEISSVQDSWHTLNARWTEAQSRV